MTCRSAGAEILEEFYFVPVRSDNDSNVQVRAWNTNNVLDERTGPDNPSREQLETHDSAPELERVIQRGHR